MEILVALFGLSTIAALVFAVVVLQRSAVARATTQVDNAPLTAHLERVERQIQATEAARRETDGSLMAQIKQVQLASTELGTQTAALVTALRKPQARGRWGELQLQRIVEVAGMVERCDFTLQHTVTDDDGFALRPDMTVNLSGERIIVVDSKVTLSAFLEAHESTDEAYREQRLQAHARHLRDHVKRLSAKEYWRQFKHSPEFVVLFVPGEAFLAPALERLPSLLEEAAADKIVIATPSTLIALLRTVAYSWQQVALADNALAIYDAGKDLYRGLVQSGAKIAEVGKQLDKATASYNAMIGSLERNVLPKARRMHDLKLSEDAAPALEMLTESSRGLASADWTRELEAAPETDSARPWTAA